MLSHWEFEAEIHTLSSFLKFSNENWEKFRQAKDEEIQKKINVLRHIFVGFQNLNDDEILNKTYEREWYEYDLWDAQDNGEFLDREFHLESEEQDLLRIIKEKDELLSNKHLFYSSFVIMSYSFIERHLIEICLNVPMEEARQLGNTRLNIHRAYKFLEKVLDYKITDPHWNELMMVKQLRNNLVHQGYSVGLQQGDDIEKLYANGISTDDHELAGYLT